MTDYPYGRGSADPSLPMNRPERSPRLTRKAEKEIESIFENTREAFRLLEIIDAEFRTDPMSVQCFDLRVVERVRECVARRKEFVRDNPLYAE